MKRQLRDVLGAVVVFGAVGLGLLYLAGALGYGGLVIVGLVEAAAIAVILRASTRA